MMTTSGWYTWLHDTTPIEWTDDLEARLRFMKLEPAADAIRFTAIIPVPEDRMPRICTEAVVAMEKARKAYVEAYEGWNYGLAYEQPRQTYEDAQQAYYMARRACAVELLILATEFAPHAALRNGVLVVADS